MYCGRPVGGMGREMAIAEGWGAGHTFGDALASSQRHGRDGNQMSDLCQIK